MPEISAAQWDELRHRQRVAEAVRKQEWPGENIEQMPKKERKPYEKRVKPATDNHSPEPPATNQASGEGDGSVEGN